MGVEELHCHLPVAQVEPVVHCRLPVAQVVPVVHCHLLVAQVEPAGHCHLPVMEPVKAIVPNDYPLSWRGPS